LLLCKTFYDFALIIVGYANIQRVIEIG